MKEQKQTNKERKKERHNEKKEISKHKERKSTILFKVVFKAPPHPPNLLSRLRGLMDKVPPQ